MDQFFKDFHAQFQKTPTNFNVPMLPGYVILSAPDPCASPNCSWSTLIKNEHPKNGVSPKITHFSRRFISGPTQIGQNFIGQNKYTPTDAQLSIIAQAQIPFQKKLGIGWTSVIQFFLQFFKLNWTFCLWEWIRRTYSPNSWYHSRW